MDCFDEVFNRCDILGVSYWMKMYRYNALTDDVCTLHTSISFK